MELLSRVASTSSPAVNFDAKTGQLTMSGESYPENTFEFYAPVIGWLKEFVAGTDIPAGRDHERFLSSTRGFDRPIWV